MAQQPQEMLRSLLIPMREGQVLVPSVTVMEVLPYSGAHDRLAGPRWLLGTLPWREGARIPLISLESLFMNLDPEPGSRARMVLLNGVGERMSHYAVIGQTVPRLVTLTRRIVTPDTRLEPLPSGVLSRVSIAGQRAVIPDLETIEAMLLEALA